MCWGSLGGSPLLPIKIATLPGRGFAPGPADAMRCVNGLVDSALSAFVEAALAGRGGREPRGPAEVPSRTGLPLPLPILAEVGREAQRRAAEAGRERADCGREETRDAVGDVDGGGAAEPGLGGAQPAEGGRDVNTGAEAELERVVNGRKGRVLLISTTTRIAPLLLLRPPPMCSPLSGEALLHVPPQWSGAEGDRSARKSGAGITTFVKVMAGAVAE